MGMITYYFNELDFCPNSFDECVALNIPDSIGSFFAHRVKALGKYANSHVKVNHVLASTSFSAIYKQKKKH